MQHSELSTQIDITLSRSVEMLKTKNGDYAQGMDALHNFHLAADLQGIKPRQACAGFMAKHAVSIFDMCGRHEIGELSVWREKISDHINYLIFLEALVVEEIRSDDKLRAELFNESDHDDRQEPHVSARHSH